MFSMSNGKMPLASIALALALCHCSSSFDGAGFDGGPADGAPDRTSPPAEDDGGAIYVLPDSPYLPSAQPTNAGLDAAPEAAADAGSRADAGSPEAGAAIPVSCATDELTCGGRCVSKDDVRNCGACGNACATAVASATPACSDATCTFACDAAHHKCGAGSSATCASDTSVNSCGTLCAPCGAPGNGVATCVASGGSYGCAFACNAGYSPCSGACLNLQGDTGNCGACGNVCTTAVAHAQPACNGGSCALTCNGGYHACGTGASVSCADDTSPQTCGSACTACPAPGGVPGGAALTCTASGGTHVCGFTCNAGLSQCGNNCLDLQNDASNCGACGHSCAPGTCSTGKCQPWTIAQATGTPASIATDGTYLAWFDTGGQKCEVISVAGAAMGGQPTAFATGNASSNGLGYVAVANGTVACLLQNTSGPQITFLQGSGGTPTPIQLTGADSGNVTGLAINATGTAAYFSNALANATGSTVNVYACNIGGGSPCSSIGTYGSSAPGNLVVSGNSVYVAEGSNGVIGALSVVNGAWSNVATGQGNINAVTADASFVYWASAGGSSFTLSRASLANLAAGPQVILPSVGGLAQGLASDGTNLYLGGAYTGTSPGYGWVATLPIAGASTASTLVKMDSSNIVYSIAYAGGTLYWADYGDGKVSGLRL